MKLQAFNCPNCKAPLNLPAGSQDRRFIFCQYCGTKIAIDDIEFYKEDSKTERSRIRADRDVRKNQVDRDTELEKERIKLAQQKEDNKMIFIILGVMVFLILILLFMGKFMG